jgi:hypothetical protein
MLAGLRVVSKEVDGQARVRPSWGFVGCGIGRGSWRFCGLWGWGEG